MMWNDELPTWWDEWNEWSRRCDVVLGHYWLSDDMWEGESSAFGPQLTAGKWTTETTESEAMDKGGLL